MNAIDSLFTSAPLALDDTQSRADARRLPIQRVGIQGLRHPVRIATAGGREQATVARFAMDVGLPEHVKGAHMSRFAEIVNALDHALDPAAFRALEGHMRTRLEAASGRLEMRFTWFREKVAPVSGAKSLLDVDAVWVARTDASGTSRLDLEVVVPVTSLCPCSKTISDYGAHNQRSHITIRAEAGSRLELDDLIDIAEAQASSELYAILKRVDEKHVTERAYDNPKFVEDLVRDIALACQAHEQIGEFMVASENFESIHNHSAYAELHGRGRLHRA
jgi:GTP cyclohydrolase FolE2